MVGYINFHPCMRCHQEDIKTKGIPDSTYYKLLMNDTGVLDFVCERGHKNYVIIQELTFEILLGIAIEDICKQHYRSAVEAFASAQERCFEFFIRLVNIEKSTSPENYEKMWRTMKNSSERQFGAFCSLFLNRFGKAFCLDEKMITIRNSITHKGTIPSKEQAFTYGNYILNNIYDIIENVKKYIPDEHIHTLIHNNVKERAESIKDKDACVSTSCGGESSLLVQKDLNRQTLEQLASSKARTAQHFDAAAKGRVEASRIINKTRCEPFYSFYEE